MTLIGGAEPLGRKAKYTRRRVNTGSSASGFSAAPGYNAGLAFRNGQFVAEIGATLTAFDGAIGGVAVTAPAVREHLQGSTILGTGSTLVVPVASNNDYIRLKVQANGLVGYSPLYPVRHAPPFAAHALTAIDTTPGVGSVTVDFAADFAGGGQGLTYALFSAPAFVTLNTTTGVATIDRNTASTGQHLVQVQATNNSGYSDISEVSVTVSSVDVTAPVLSSAGLSAVGNTAATGSVTTDEGFGTLWWVLTTAATSPSAAQVKAGQDHTGAAALRSASQSVNAAGAQSIAPPPSGLPQNTNLYLHCVQDDSANPANTSAVISSSALNLTPVDITAPILSSASVLDTTLSTVSVQVTTDEGNGTVFVVVVPSGNAPTAQQIVAGQNHTGGAAVGASSIAVVSTGVKQVTVTGLTPSTIGYAYAAHRDAAGNLSNVVSCGMFTTDAAGSIGAYLDNSAAVTLRDTMVSYHLTPRADDENTFRGFGSDLSAFTAVTVTSMSAAVTAANGLALGTKKAIYLDWDGVSSSGTRINGHSSTALAGQVNASVDWGYNRPATSVVFLPAPGRSPKLSGTYSAALQLGLLGYNKVEFRDVEFVNTQVSFTRTSTYPTPAMAAFNRCKFTDCANGAVILSGVRSYHVEGCHFHGCKYGVIGAAEFIRIWNNWWTGHLDNDLASTRGYTAGFMSGWKANIWMFGNRSTMNSQTAFTSGLHPDAFQINADTDIHQGHRLLLEFNIFDMDNNPAAYPTQVFFGNNYALSNSNDWLVHNNMVAASAYWACSMADPADAGTKIAWRNTFLRSAKGTNPVGTATGDTYQVINSVRRLTGSGSLLIGKCYYADEPTQHGKVSNETRVGNINVDPRRSAAVGARPQDHFTGNGSWSTNAYGYQVYDLHLTGLTKEQAVQAFVDFVHPLVGWNGADCGIIDPATWPTDPVSLSSGAAPVLTSPTGTQTGSTTASGTVSANGSGGTLFRVTLASGAAAPSGPQIIAGTDANDTAANAGSQAVSAAGVQNISVTGLSAGVSYKHHYVWRDATNTLSSVVSSAAFTTAGSDTTAPVLSSPTDTASGATAMSGTVSTDEANGTLYWVVSTSASAPTALQVEAGQMHTGSAAAASGSQAVSATGQQDVTDNGLTASTTYYTHYMHKDSAGNRSTVVSADGFTTTAASSDAVVVQSAVILKEAATVSGKTAFGPSASFTVGSGPNRALSFTFIGMDTASTSSTGTPTLSNVVFNGQTVTILGYRYHSGDRVWIAHGYLPNPTSGAGTLSFNTSTNNYSMGVTCTELNHAHQSTSPSVLGGGTSTSGLTQTASGTTANNGSLFIGAVGIGQRTALPSADITITDGTSLGADHSGATDLKTAYFASAYKAKATAGAESVAFSWPDSAVRKVWQAIEVLRAA